MSEQNKPDEVNEEKPKYQEKVNIDASKQLDDLVTDMPPVVEDAVEAAGIKESENQKINAEFKDNKGRSFDASIHLLDPATGNPVLTPTGRFKRKINIPKDKVNIPEGGQTDAPINAQVKIQAAIWADAFIHLGMSIAGEEWKPENIDGKLTERDLLIAANERYMLEKGVVNLPAWAELALAYSMYSIKRFNKPKTRSVIEKITGKVKLMVTNLWLKITGKGIQVVKTDDKKESEKK